MTEPQDPTHLDLLKEEYANALHAMQTGVMYYLQLNNAEGTSKHLRVGVNSALCSQRALLTILVEKGITTEEEYFTQLLAAVQEDVKSYEKLLSDHYGKEVTLH